ncbi:MAG: type II toxin-antitoxin system VapC family toxin [Actinobacteria bacterium]|nr:type II toxin-antitoxin system VapC family toxin [Actinomycetota bacterium]
MGTVIIDAGLVIGHLNSADAHHVAARTALRAYKDDVLVLPASAYAEVMSGPVLRGTDDVARAAISALAVAVGPIDEASAEAAAALRAVHRSLRLPDALVLGHAEAIGADVVLTTDRRWSAVSPRVRVV